jgi:UDP-GlcNAc:undecaprenyl-phosphate/decaprenyl-phosphate GlcNAc-1-phosphate transferase
MIISLAFFTSLISILTLRSFAIRFNFVDFPTERKNHVGNIPLIGGICIFLGALISYIFFIEFNKFFNILLFTASLILIQGVWDDYKNLKAKTKMAFQAFLTVIIIYTTDIKLDSLGHLFWMSQSIELGILSIPITVIAVVGLTNAINMIDGIDGLAISLVTIAIIGMLSFNLNSDMSSFAELLLAIVAASLPFMVFNIVSYPKKKIFLGDGGSLFLGFIISWALIYSTQIENNFNPSFALWCVAIPLFDFFTVIAIRLLEKRSLIVASKDHIHHILQNEGFSKLKILLLIVFPGLIILLVGRFIEDNAPTLSFSMFTIIFLIYLLIRIFKIIKNKSERYQ